MGLGTVPALPMLAALGNTPASHICRAIRIEDCSASECHGCILSVVLTVSNNRCRASLAAVSHVSRDVLIVGFFFHNYCMHLSADPGSCHVILSVRCMTFHACAMTSKCVSASLTDCLFSSFSFGLLCRLCSSWLLTLQNYAFSMYCSLECFRTVGRQSSLCDVTPANHCHRGSRLFTAAYPGVWYVQRCSKQTRRINGGAVAESLSSSSEGKRKRGTAEAILSRSFFAKRAVITCG